MDQFKQTLIDAIQDNIEEMINPSREYTDKEIIWKRGYNQALQDMLNDFTEDYNKFIEDLIKVQLN
jgi:predicted house-cleaning noncanonical NTP pyrophosphatase (MazG superfamily)